MLVGGGARTRASLRAAAFATSTQPPPTQPPPGGYWQQWEREMNERRAQWDEAQQRLQAQRALQAEEWRRIRQAWAEGATQQPPRERVKWWWEGGEHRASPEQAAAWQRQFQGATEARVSAPARGPGDARGHYAALGLVTMESRRADAATLQAAFRRTVLANHPDTAKNGADDEARTRRFRAAVAAYDVLRDNALRERYDRDGAV